MNHPHCLFFMNPLKLLFSFYSCVWCTMHLPWVGSSYCSKRFYCFYNILYINWVVFHNQMCRDILVHPCSLWNFSWWSWSCNTNILNLFLILVMIAFISMVQNASSPYYITVDFWWIHSNFCSHFIHLYGAPYIFQELVHHIALRRFIVSIIFYTYDGLFFRIKCAGMWHHSCKFCVLWLSMFYKLLKIHCP